MKHNIIVVDNEWRKRQLGYETLAQESSRSAAGLEFEMDYVTHPNELATKLHTKHYSAAIIDAVLDDTDDCWRTFSISEALQVIGGNIPIAVLSERWDQTNSKEINQAWKHSNCRTFLHWRDIDPSGNGQIDYAARVLTALIADQIGLEIDLNLAHNDPIRIVHISDLQVGGFAEEGLEANVSQCADFVLEHWKDETPTFIAFTGDVTEYGRPDQYEKASKWIAYFCERLGFGQLPSRRILYVPGNHDVNIALAAASRIQVQKDKDDVVELKLSDSIQTDLLNYAYTPFREFLSGIWHCPYLPLERGDQNFAWVEARYQHLGVVFYGVNTAQPASAFGLPDRHVDPKALDKIANELEKSVRSPGQTSTPLVVGLGHHCPTSASDDSAVSNPKAFEKLFLRRVKTALFLHGHTHEHEFTYQTSRGWRLVRSCAPTLTKGEIARPPDTVRGFNLIELNRDKHAVRSISGASFGWIGCELKPICPAGPWTLKSDGMFGE